MATVVECTRTPGRVSIWSARLGKYVCSHDPEFARVMAEQSTATSVARPPISAAFKLVFLTAAGGTLFFVVMCVVLTMLVGKSQPDFLQRVVLSMLDLAKIGFGAVAGLLGGQHLKA